MLKMHSIFVVYVCVLISIHANGTAVFTSIILREKASMRAVVLHKSKMHCSCQPSYNDKKL